MPARAPGLCARWFATYNAVGVRMALEDCVEAVLFGKATPLQGSDGSGCQIGGWGATGRSVRTLMPPGGTVY